MEESPDERGVVVARARALGLVEARARVAATNPQLNATPI